jgi:hypothetical protein
MRTFILIVIYLLLCPWGAFAGHVSVERAQTVGQHFLSQQYSLEKKDKNSLNLQLVYTDGFTENSRKSHQSETAYFYVFNASEAGFVIIAGDDRVNPVLGYSTTGTFDPNRIPDNCQKWLEGYRQEIRYVTLHDLPAAAETERQWSDYFTGAVVKTRKGTASVAPLLGNLQWDQNPYYNNLCPYDNVGQERTVTGCVATAMAQVMKYWNYPAQGTGSHSYNHDKYGTLSANFGLTTYQWSSMPNKLTSSSTSTQKTAVATLMYHCGVSVEMDYGTASEGGSAAVTICSGYGISVCAENALKTYFDYKTTLQGIHKIDYTNANWINILKNELDSARPVLYAGRGSGGGHAFVCDGYDNSNYFHFNWGWSGSNDGYYSLTSLTPGSGGSGGGSYSFTDDQRAIIGIEPASSGIVPQNYDLRLYSSLNMPSQVRFGSAFSLTADIANYGTGVFTGQIAVAIFNDNFDFVDLVADSCSIPGGLYAPVTLMNPGSTIFVPGIYYATLFYKTVTQDWTQISGGNYTNMVQFEVYNSADIETYSVFTITSPGGKLIQGEMAAVNVNVLNSGTDTCYGKFRVSLASLDGLHVQNIQILDASTYGLPAGYYYTDGLTFTGTITASPGTYLMSVDYQWNGEAQWYYAGSSIYQNPVYVIVEAPPIQPDPYEPNNTVNQAYELPVSFSGNTVTKNTVGSNFHIGTDKDYYKIHLPSGYNYTISARIHDSYGSGNGNTYSVDGLFSYSVDGSTWSNAYDDIMPDNITVHDGGTVYFYVVSYLTGSTGTYLLDMTINRTKTSMGTEEIEMADRITIYPNPAKEYVTVDLNQCTGTAHSITIHNVQGQQVGVVNISDAEKTLQLPLQGLSDGMYFIQIHALQGILTRKMMIAK